MPEEHVSSDKAIQAFRRIEKLVKVTASFYGGGCLELKDLETIWKFIDNHRDQDLFG